MNINDIPIELLEIVLNDIHLHNNILSNLYTPIIVLNDKMRFKKDWCQNDIHKYEHESIHKMCFYNNIKLSLMYNNVFHHKYGIYKRMVIYCIQNNNKKMLKHFYSNEKYNSSNSGIMYDAPYKCIAYYNKKMLKYCIKQIQNIKNCNEYSNTEISNNIIYVSALYSCTEDKFDVLKYSYKTLNDKYRQKLLESHSFNEFVYNNASNKKIQSWLPSIGYKN